MVFLSVRCLIIGTYFRHKSTIVSRQKSARSLSENKTEYHLTNPSLPDLYPAKARLIISVQSCGETRRRCVLQQIISQPGDEGMREYRDNRHPAPHCLCSGQWRHYHEPPHGDAALRADQADGSQSCHPGYGCCPPPWWASPGHRP